MPVLVEHGATSRTTVSCRSWAAEKFTKTPQVVAPRALLPGHGLAAGLGEQVATERDDEPGLLGHLHELGRGQQAPLRVVPAHEGLEAGHPVVA